MEAAFPNSTLQQYDAIQLPIAASAIVFGMQKPNQRQYMFQSTYLTI